MKAAAWPRARPGADRLLVMDPRTGARTDTRLAGLADRLRPGDLLVLNDAATLPASLMGHGPGGEPLELRLAGRLADRVFRAVLFGAGDWRTATEKRPLPPRLAAGAHLDLGPHLAARVLATEDGEGRIVRLAFDRGSPALEEALYRAGRPIQYSYLGDDLPLELAQTPVAARPWAFEPCSAARPLQAGTLLALASRGIGLARLTHAAGISSTGSDALDRSLPWPERYEIPRATGAAVARARRVIAVGTTVTRALESAALPGPGRRVRPGPGIARLRLDAGHRLRVVDGILTGIHGPGSSHGALLEAFAPGPLLKEAYEHAAAAGYLEHEFGDSCLILADPADARSEAA